MTGFILKNVYIAVVKYGRTIWREHKLYVCITAMSLKSDFAFCLHMRQCVPLGGVTVRLKSKGVSSWGGWCGGDGEAWITVK